MTRDELNTALKMEIINYRKTDVLTPDLKRLLMEIVWLETPKPRYRCISDNVKILCEADAFVAACKHCIHYDPKKSDNAFAYVVQVVWSSYYGTIKKHAVELGLKTTRTTYKFK
jgi:hypothetical protein